MSRYNNDVTYDKKWDTEENRAALAKLEAKFFPRSNCCPDTPLAWAPEVLELLETIDRELGIARNVNTMEGYTIQDSFFQWWFVSPFKRTWWAIESALGPTPSYRKTPYTIKERLTPIKSAPIDSVIYAYRATMVRYVNPLINRVLKPKANLSQIKEKYGSLTLYLDVPNAFEEWVDRLERECEVKLAIKGAYYPLASLWDTSSTRYLSSKWNQDETTIEVDKDGTRKLKKTLYRQMMVDMGVDVSQFQKVDDVKV